MKRAHRPASGFTLVELMVVVAIIGAASAVGVTVYRNNARAAATPNAARALYGMVAEARHAAMALNTQTRVQVLVSSTTVQLKSAQRQPDTTWLDVATYNVPPTVEVCTPRTGPLLGTVAATTVTCPATSTTVCMDGGGHTTFSTDGTCPGTGGSGATFFLRSKTATQPFKVVVFGLTGLARLLDKW